MLGHCATDYFLMLAFSLAKLPKMSLHSLRPCLILYIHIFLCLFPPSCSEVTGCAHKTGQYINVSPIFVLGKAIKVCVQLLVLKMTYWEISLSAVFIVQFMFTHITWSSCSWWIFNIFLMLIFETTLSITSWSHHVYICEHLLFCL